MKKRRWWIIGAVALLTITVIGVIVLLNSGDKNPYAKASMSISRSDVDITMDVQSMYVGMDTTSQVAEVDIYVNGMPDGISSDIFVFSENKNIATAVAGTSNGGVTRVTITAQNSGQTRIRITASGLPVQYINVNVAVPARSVTTKPDMQFAVIKGKTESAVLEFEPSNFDFYATTSKLDGFRYTTTVNDLEFKLKDERYDGIEIQGNKFIVPSTAVAEKVTVQATLFKLEDPPAPLEFDVYVFEPFNDIVIRGTDGEVLPEYVSLVANYQEYNIFHKENGYTDYQDCAVTVSNTTYNIGTNFGFYITNRFQLNVLSTYENYIEAGHNFRLTANGAGTAWIDVVVYPIAKDGTKFNLARHSGVQKTKRIYVDVRNAFTGMADNPLFVDGIKDNDLNVFTRVSDISKFYLNFEAGKQIQITNMPPRFSTNANITFELSEGDILEHFDMTSNGHQIRSMEGGFPYTNEFGIVLRESSNLLSLPQSEWPQIIVKSLDQGMMLGEIDLVITRSIDDIVVTNSVNGTETKILYPVRDASIANPADVNYSFTVSPRYLANNNLHTVQPGERDIMAANSVFDFVFENPVHRELFNIVPDFTVPGQVRFDISIKTAADNKQVNVPLSDSYKLNLVYASGFSVPLNVVPLDRINWLQDTYASAVSEDALNYPDGANKEQVLNTGRIIDRAVVRIGGEYTFNADAGWRIGDINTFTRSNTEVWALIRPSAGGEASRTVTFDTEGFFEYEIQFNAHNNFAFASGMRDDWHTVRVYVVNPLLSIELDKYYIDDLKSRDTVYSERNQEPPASLRDVRMTLKYYQAGDVLFGAAVTPGDYSNIARVQNTVRTGNIIDYTIQGMYSSVEATENGYVPIEFAIEQRIQDEAANGGDGSFITIYTTGNRPLPLMVRVEDAISADIVDLRGLGNVLNLDVGSSFSVGAIANTVNGIDPTDTRVGYAFEVNGDSAFTLDAEEPGYIASHPTGNLDPVSVMIVTDYAKVTSDGVITAEKSTIESDVMNIVLYMYTLDSIRDGKVPTVFARVTINIFDNETTHIIRTTQDFLNSFYTHDTGNRWLGKDFSSPGAENDYYRIVGNINLAGYELTPIKNFGGQIVGTNQYSIGSNTEAAQYSVSNFKITNENALVNGTARDYGMFTNLIGRIEGINFLNAAVNITGTANSNANLGIIASNVGASGIIRDVTVEIRDANYNAAAGETLNIGAAAGVNAGTVEEKNRLNVLGVIKVNAPTSGTYTVNMGGLVGKNDGGDVINATAYGARAIYSQNIMINSEVTLLAQGGGTGTVNIGGLAGLNTNGGNIENMSSENVIVNRLAGNTGGSVGLNENASEVKFCYSNSAVYTASAVTGGLVGVNNGTVSNCYLDSYVNWDIYDREQEFSSYISGLTKFAGGTIGAGTAGSGITVNTAKPVQIDFLFRDNYTSFYGQVMNDHGGFNYAVPASNNKDSGNLLTPGSTFTGYKPGYVPSAALFYTNGLYRSGNYSVANKYYLNDIFLSGNNGKEIVNFTNPPPPAQLSKRISLDLVGEGDIARLGTDRKGYYIELFGLGSFEIVATAGSLGANITARAKLEIVEGFSQTTLTTDAGFGQVGFKSLLAAHPKSIIRDFAVPAHKEFLVYAAADNTAWQFQAYKDEVHLRADVLESYGPYANGSQVTSVSFDSQNLEHLSFRFIPYLLKAGYRYLCTDMTMEVDAHFYSGATRMSLEQGNEKNKPNIGIDPSSAAFFVGTVITNETGIKNGVTAGDVTGRLRNIINLSYEIGDNDYDLFTDPNSPTRTTVPLDDRWSLVFTLQARIDTRADSTVPEGYTRYNYEVIMSVDVSRFVYGSSIDIGSRPSVRNSLSGALSVKEIPVPYNFTDDIAHNYEPKQDKCFVEIFDQEVQAVSFQHFSRTEGINPETIAADIDVQYPSNSLYFDTLVEGNGGLLKVITNPSYSCVDTVSLKADPITIGGTRYDILFVQLVLDLKDNVYKKKGWTSFLPISTQVINGDSIAYSWNGVYYFETRLRKLDGETELIPDGTEFNVNVEMRVLDLQKLNNGDGDPYKTISNITDPNTIGNLRLAVSQRAGLYFDYYGESRRGIQAVDTTRQFTTYMVGVGSLMEWDIENVKPKYTVSKGDNANGGYESWVNYIPGSTGNWNITVPADVSLIGQSITIEVFYTTSEFGGILPGSTKFTIDIALFRIIGFRVGSVIGDNIRLTNYNPQDMQIRIDADYNRATSSQTLLTATEKGISDLENKINNDEYERLIWTGYNDGEGGYHLNDASTWNPDSHYYEDRAYNDEDVRQLNFMLGKDMGAAMDRNNKYLVASPLAESDASEITLRIQLFYYYDRNSGLFEIASMGQQGAHEFYQDFTVNTVTRTDSRAPTMIRNMSDPAKGYVTLKEMQPNGHYIIMEDLVLGDWQPIPFNMASLDGNNKKIYLNGFNLGEARPNVGLFTVIEPNSVIKNVNIVLPSFNQLVQTSLEVDLTRYPESVVEANVGTLAGINRGIITNCAVLVDSQFDPNIEPGHPIADYNASYANKNTGAALARLAVYAENVNLMLNVGGLVGKNEKDIQQNYEGVISNSRVLIDVHVSSRNPNASAPNVQMVVVAGFTGRNDGIIVSSFFRDAGVVNKCRNRPAGGTGGGEVGNLTAGFVGYNTGKIKASYAEGLTSGQSTLEGMVSSGEVYSSNAAAAGFVYRNTGTGAVIEDCYVSIWVNGAEGSGFLHENRAGGLVQNCYVNNPKHPSSAYHSFSRTYNSTEGTYLNNKFRDYKSQYASTMAGYWDRIIDDDLDNPDAFGFSISSGKDNTWVMTKQGPRLVAANNVAISIRIESFNFAGNSVLTDMPGYGYGTEINPIIITNGLQFNTEIYENSLASLQDYYLETEGSIDYSKNIYSHNIRLANNISLHETVLGVSDVDGLKIVQTYKTIYTNAVFDGNGLSITDISVNASEALRDRRGNLNSVGLFSKIENGAVVKNINLTFSRGSNTTSSIWAVGAIYTGGLAGTVTDSKIVDIDITGNPLGTDGRVHVYGDKITGGLVGYAVNSVIDSISAAITVESGEGSGGQINSDVPFYDLSGYMAHDDTKISIAGGIVGIATNETELGNLTNGGSVSVSGEIVGGLVGAIADYEDVYSEEDADTVIGHTATVSTVTADGLVLNPMIDILLRGKYYAGGLVGVNFGTVTDSSVRSYISFVNQGTGWVVDYTPTGLNSVGHQKGIIIGGAAGYNGGTISGITVNITSGAFGNANIWVTGGVAGENVGGTVQNSTVTGTLNSGFYIGGVVGIDNGGSVLDNGNSFAGKTENVKIEISSSGNNNIISEIFNGNSTVTIDGIPIPIYYFDIIPYTGTWRSQANPNKKIAYQIVAKQVLP